MRCVWATLAVLALAASRVAAVKRQHYVGADQVWWNYAPSGENQCVGAPFDERTGLYTLAGLGSRYLKAVYQEYTDGTFQTLKTRTADETHLGIIGPVIYATPGDEVEVVLRNNLNFPINIVPSGLVTNDTEALAANGTRAYSWSVQAEDAPNVASSRPFLYRSTVDQQAHAKAGLVGIVVVTRAKDARPGGQPGDVDRELFTLFEVMDETLSPLINATRKAAGWTNTTGPLNDADFAESSKKHQMNGFLYCNAPGMTAPFGKKVRWYVFVEGAEVDLHNAHWHGNVLLRDGHRVDQHSLLPGDSQVLDMVPDNPGTWLYHCHVNDHILAGMMSLYTVAHANGTAATAAPALPTSGAGAGAVREYFIAALQGVWDYAPLGSNACVGQPSSYNDTANGFMQDNATALALGRRQIKAQYVEFTDATFTVRKNRSAEDEYLGLLGPVMRAAVGDTIRVTFKNGVPHNATLHPHGVFYLKDAEGAPYNDGTSGNDKKDDVMPPGSSWTFVWQVSERAAPGPADPSSLMYMYHSHFDEVADVNAGLTGAIIVSRKDVALPSGAPSDVDREFVLSYSIQDEVKSFFFAQNLAQLGTGLSNDQQTTLAADDTNAANEQFHTINGMLYCNLPHLHAKVGDRVRLHIFALGTENGIHAPAIIASTMNLEGASREAAQLQPGAMHSLDVALVAPGAWQVVCRTANHYADGMTAIIDVASNGLTAAAPAGAPSHAYFIAAEREQWNYAPYGSIDNCTGTAIGDAQTEYVDPAGPGLGSVYAKALYREYTNAGFQTRKAANATQGILGPTLHAHVGDTLTVVFTARPSVKTLFCHRNKLPFDVNLHVSGGLTPLNGTSDVDAVAPNATVVLSYYVPASAGPGPADGAAVAYTYRSTVDPQAHDNAGLVGALVVSSQGMPAPDAEVPLLFSIQDETLSAFSDVNMAAAAAANKTVNTTDPNFAESMKKYCVNGYVFCQGPRVNLTQGADARLVLLDVGGETDFHLPVFTNSLLLTPRAATYTQALVPGSVRVVELTTDNPGLFEFHDNVEEHYLAGMKGVVEVQPKVGVIAPGQLPIWRRARRALA